MDTRYPPDAGRTALHTVDSLTIYRGRVTEILKRLKYGGETEWAAPLGRLLLRHLDQARRPGDVDLIVANPTHRTRPVRHTELLLEALALADVEGRWPVDDPARPVIVKTRPTAKSHRATHAARQAIAADLEQCLVVIDPGRVADRHILVLDDVYTTGAQLGAVARVLAAAGAASTSGLVLARVPAPQLALAPSEPGGGIGV